MNTLGLWASIIALSMTPNLLLGSSTALAVGIQAHLPPGQLLPVVALASYLEGLLVAWLAERSTHLAWVQRWIERMRTPRNLGMAERWGVWGGLTLGCALVGQEPILVALRWLGVGMRRLWLPLAVSNILFTGLYYLAAAFGLDQLARL